MKSLRQSWWRDRIGERKTVLSSTIDISRGRWRRMLLLLLLLLLLQRWTLHTGDEDRLRLTTILGLSGRQRGRRPVDGEFGESVDDDVDDSSFVADSLGASLAVGWVVLRPRPTGPSGRIRRGPLEAVVELTDTVEDILDDLRCIRSTNIDKLSRTARLSKWVSEWLSEGVSGWRVRDDRRKTHITNQSINQSINLTIKYDTITKWGEYE